ncbi:hypothetical protein CWS02_10670 [Enterobacter sp. EA-1]|nr:hypothetical protein CWS02_10670 [Enterobacter sp. EA-1]
MRCKHWVREHGMLRGENLLHHARSWLLATSAALHQEERQRKQDIYAKACMPHLWHGNDVIF